MITVYLGGKEAKQALRKDIAVFSAKYPSALILRIDAESFSLLRASEELSANDLFGHGSLIVFEGIMDEQKYVDAYTELKEIISESQNSVYICETTLPKDVLESLRESGAHIQEFREAGAKEREYGTIFTLADAYVSGNRKTAWVEFSRAIRGGKSAEEIHGTLFWAIKSLWLSRKLTKSQAEALGIKPFVLSKYKTLGAEWGDGEINQSLSTLKDLYHQSHRGKGQLAVLLEQYLLSF